MDIVLDRKKYSTVEDLLNDYVFIQKPQSEKIVFLDLNEAGHYYPYSTTKRWKFNSLYHIYKNLHIDNYEKTYFYNNDIHLNFNHQQVVKLLGLKKYINVKSFPWYTIYRGFRRGNFNLQNILATYAVSQILRFNINNFLKLIKNFKGLPHRQELFFKRKRVYRFHCT